MKPCKRVGVDTTYRCNWNCDHCFYRRSGILYKPEDVPLAEVQEKILTAKAGGLDHVVLVGFGEPSIGKTTPAILDFAREQGMATSMITNAATGLDRFKRFFDQGLDHLHISSHGLDGTLDDIVGIPGAFKKQAEVKEWLASEGLPFRTNVTLQKKNYRELVELAEYEIGHGVYHFVMLGFLPHYEWREHAAEVAVHPAELRPYIEAAADLLIEAGTFFTIRYQPFCHLATRYWKYVVNARYVFFDPWEWNYDLQANDFGLLWSASVAMGNSTAVKGPPCSGCSAYRHCGGWNAVSAATFDGAGLTAIHDPGQYSLMWHHDGGVHDLNPANALRGTIR